MLNVLCDHNVTIQLYRIPILKEVFKSKWSILLYPSADGREQEHYKSVYYCNITVSAVIGIYQSVLWNYS